ncbi:YwiC-like family protein [Nocardioides sp.]|uniref:YwiC-like family protein n=1 Tax=Nocardioides sp. TaxID=35761 RepID=UPI001A1CDB08|nr:YwiC-like family protein [Nocardioides sp.]MBJ7357812.1 YwiC-like family protein [Nocardioides sp.]
MTTATVRPGPARPRKDRVLPDQHGAWGFLLLPVVLALAVGGWAPALPVLVVAWVAAYPLTWALTGLLAAPRPQRFRRALVVWSVVAVPAAAAAVVLRPWLLYVGAAYVGLFLVNLWFARQRRERSLANDLVLVAECTAMVPVVAGAAAAGGWAVPVGVMRETAVLVLALACAVTLAGSTLHVKSLIRERRNPRYGQASRAYAVVSVVVMTVAVLVTEVGAVLVVPFVALAVRAFVVRDPRLRPAKIGLVELACLLVLAACAFVAV